MLELDLEVHLSQSLGLGGRLVRVLLDAAALEATFEYFAGHFLLTALTVGRHDLFDRVGGVLSLWCEVGVHRLAHEAGNT